MPNGWNLADVLDTVAAKVADAPALVHAGRTTTWREFERRAGALATALVRAGAGRQAKVAQYLYNGPEYVESFYAACKAALVPVNTNYRYTADELAYLWDNADAVAVVFHGSFADRCAAAAPKAPGVHTWLWVDDGSGPCPPWATPYEAAIAAELSGLDASGGAATPPWGRSGDDLMLLYTGGTTGMPKGVMWRQDDLAQLLDTAVRTPLPAGEQDLGFVAGRTTAPGARHLAAAPLMHGTGLFMALTSLLAGGSVATLTGRSFDVVEVLDTIEQQAVKSMSMVGDAFAKPLVRAMDAEPDRWDVSSMRVAVTSGVMCSAEAKAGLLRHMPRLIVADTLGSSEAIGMAGSITTATDLAAPRTGTARFRIGPDTRAITDDGRFVEPGSGEVGRLARRGHLPVGYYKDEAKTAATFVTVAGERWSIPGDWVTVDADGTLTLLGRGSQCINTGGEKVFPEEVEETLKRHPSVADAAVVGVPDERFGQAVTAIVEANAGAVLDEAALVAHVRETLAAYKAPRRVLTVDSIGRAPNGKLDYKTLTALARHHLGIDGAGSPP